MSSGAPTPRQRQVLDELARDGASTAQIAERLGISRQTARTHMQSLLNKTRLPNRTALAVWWLRQQLSEGSDPYGIHTDR